VNLPLASRAVRSAKAALVGLVGLSKPWIIALLLITTWAGMFLGMRGTPPVGLFLLTTLGGTLAAAGANAINSYLDRDIDGRMNRTARRPLPSGRVAPRRALTYGIAATLGSVLVLGLGVNWLAAGLALLGNLYYVLVYTLWLKRKTPLNIVIGGAAGAIPPLVGWAAATNRVDLLGVFLFLIVVYWTPPHTWALAILLRGDYQRVSVPMLPVVAGEEETRRQVWLYSLQMVAMSLLPIGFHLLGGFYFLVASGLGLAFLREAWQLRFGGEKGSARKVYRFSQVYLALLFLAMVIDRLI
jgi:protoheme IX farnesyltransferase